MHQLVDCSTNTLSSTSNPLSTKLSAKRESTTVRSSQAAVKGRSASPSSFKPSSQPSSLQSAAGAPAPLTAPSAEPIPFSPPSVPSASVNRQTVSILLVDDDARFRQGIRTLLDFCSDKGHYDFVVVGEAASGQQAIELIKQQHPILVLLDVELTQGKTDGIDVLCELQKLPQAPRVLMMSAHQEDDVIFKCMQSGAFGYVPKSQIAEQLYGAITTVLKNQIYLASTSMTSFFRIFHFHAGRSLRACQSIHLSPREHEVLSFLVEGYSNETIAKALYISVATVKAHLTSVFEKLSVKSRTQAIVAALKLGLV